MGQAETTTKKTLATEQAPSMEEILLSIRNVIAGIADRQEAPKSTPLAPSKTIDDDVLELTDVVDHNGVPLKAVNAVVENFDATHTNKRITTAQQDNPVLHQIDKAIENISTQTTKAALSAVTSRPNADHAPATALDESLLATDTVNKTAHALQGLVKKLRTNTPTPATSDRATTIEDLVTETLKPYLTQWMNHHLPTLVERIVEREVKQLIANHTQEDR